MPKYLKSNSTGKAGLNYVKSIVDSHNCIFQKIDQENDVGVDALIELVKDEIPTGDFVATQIKSGNSYFDKKANTCKIPVGTHREYWQNYSLPVYGIVYVPEIESAYWINIKKYLKNNPSDSVISFEPTLVNIFNEKTFQTQFVPLHTGQVPKITYELALKLFKSEKRDEMYLGLYTLFKRFADNNKVWRLFIEYFKEKPISEIPGQLIYYLAVIPWHPDIFFYKDSYTKDSRDFGRKLIEQFERKEVLKLLHFVDNENMISRGSLGQSVEAIISIIPNFSEHLQKIIMSNDTDLKIKEVAGVILAFHNGKESIKFLSTFKNESWFIQELIDHIKDFGGYNPYQ